EAAFDVVARENLLGRVSSPQYLADAVWMLLHNDAINGQCIWVDGGQRFMDQPRDVMFMGQGAV
ncbi:MAG: short-chain dehydrogenase, partial [Alphaproteobacteria bacterium]|nr:short-chain dehydrogenase [Alphaproteobacteria bacterium]